MAKKKAYWLENIGSCVLILALLESLCVPRLLLRSTPATGLGRPPTTESATDFLAGDGKGYFRPRWRDGALQRVIRAVYPRWGLEARMFTDQIDPSPMEMANRHLAQSHSEGTSSGGRALPASDFNEDLSLEEYDLIDVLWRQDINVEKGFDAPPPSPEHQHEHDLQLLTDKQLTLTPQQSVAYQQQQLFESLTKAYQELQYSQEAYYSLDPFFGKLDPNIDKFVAKTVPQNLAATSSAQHFAEEKCPSGRFDEVLENFQGCSWEAEKDPLGLDELVFSAKDGLEDIDLDSLLGSNLGLADLETYKDGLSPENDVFLDSVAVVPSNSPPADGGLGSTFSEDSPSVASLGGDTLGDFDAMLTPQLELTPADLAALFADRQLADDIYQAAADTNKPDFSASYGDEAARVSRDHDYHANSFLVEEPVIGESPPGVPSSSLHEQRLVSRLEGKLVPKVPCDEALVGEREMATSRASSHSHDGMQKLKKKSGRKSKDGEVAEELGLTHSPETVAEMSLSDFKRMLKQGHFNKPQAEMIKKMRRRGRNKEAARNCRKRKQNTIEQLQMENEILRKAHGMEGSTKLSPAQ